MRLIALAIALAGCGGDGNGIKLFTAYGDQVCVAHTDGSVDCWGANTFGELANGSFGGYSLVPSRALISDVVDLVSGEVTVCAIGNDRSLVCWGAGALGQVGDGGGADRATPARVTLPGPVAEVRSSQTHTCARLEDGSGYCWGSNMFGQLGYATPTMQLAPQPTPLDGKALTLGDNVTCVIHADATAWCWGRNERGELGDGTVVSRPTPAQVAIADPVVAIAGGCHRHLCAVTDRGEVWCWGENVRGQVGTGSISTDEPMPVRVAGITNAVQVSVGASHSCARTSTNEIWCWGDGFEGQLGNGSFDDQPLPVRVTGLGGTFTDLQLTCSASFALRDDGVLFDWGSYAMLGTGERINRATAAAIP